MAQVGSCLGNCLAARQCLCPAYVFTTPVLGGQASIAIGAPWAEPASAIGTVSGPAL